MLRHVAADAVARTRRKTCVRRDALVRRRYDAFKDRPQRRRHRRRRCRRSGHIFVDLDKVSVDVVDVQEVGRVQRDGLVAKRRIVIHHDELITSRLNVCQKNYRSGGEKVR